MRGGTPQGGINFFFQEFFASIDKILLLAGGLGGRAIILWDLRLFSLIFPISRELVGKLVYTFFLIIKRAAFHLW